MGVRQDSRRKHGKPWTCSYVLALLLIWGMAAPLAWAQQQTRRTQPSTPKTPARIAATSTESTQPATRLPFNIPSQPLPQALTEFSLATGVQILSPADQPVDHPSPPLVGTYTPEQALQRLLANTGFTYRFTEANTVTLERSIPPRGAGRQVAAAPSEVPRPLVGEVLPAEPVTVREQRPPVTGYVATSSATGTKIEVPLLDVPQSIQIVPRQVIDDQRAITLSDVLRNVSGFSPAVSSQSQRFGDRNAIFRGFTTNNYYSNGFKDAFNGDSFTYGLANIEQVEVLKGPSSVLYGQGAPSGTINILTKQPLPDWYAAGSVTAGSFGYVNPSLDVSGPLTPGKELRFRLNAAYQREDSFIDFVESERYIVAPVLALSIGPSTQLTLEGEYQVLGEIFSGGLPFDGTIRENPNGRIPSSRYLGDAELEGDNFPERTLGKLGYRLDHRFNAYVSVRHGFRFSYNSRDERDILGVVLQADQRTFDRDLFVAKGWRRDYYALTDLAFDFKTGPLGHKLIFGSDQRFLSTDDRTATDVLPPIDVFNPTYGGLVDPIGPTTPRRIFDQSGQFIGIYAQNLVTIVDQVKLLVGGRYDLATLDTESGASDTDTIIRSESDDSVFTPRVGLVFQPVPQVALYTSYTTSFNPLLGTTFDGRAFEPEEGIQYEAGVKVDLFGGRLSSTLALYHLTKENVLTDDPDNPGFSIQIGEQRSRGVEVDIAGNVLPGLRLIASYAYTDAKITKSTPLFGIPVQGNRPANVPEHTVSVWGIYNFQDGFLRGLGFGLGVIAVGSRPSDDFATADLPSYVRTDAALYYRPWKHLDLALNFKNLFDVDYFETSTFATAENGISPGAPFSVFGTITARY